MQNAVSGAITVPASFFGIASDNWPLVYDDPNFGVGRWHSYADAQTHWSYIHTATNTISWTRLDAIVAALQAKGVQAGTYVISGCPAFIASTGAAVQGPWGILGEGAYPSDLGQLTYFCQQFAARNVSTWDGFFDVVSLFNEPFFGAATTPSANLYFWGTATQYVDMLWTAYTALKTADATLTVLTPGMFDLSDNVGTYFSGIGQWLNTAGTVNPTKIGADCFDGMASHPYNAAPKGKAFSGVGTLQGLQLGGIAVFQNKIGLSHPGAGIYHATEYGYRSTVDDELTAFLAKPAAYRASFIQCLWIDAMLAGVKSMNLWLYAPGVALTGDLTTDDPGTVSGLRALYNACAGKTIVAPSGVTVDGGRFLTFSDGSTYTVAAP